MPAGTLSTSNEALRAFRIERFQEMKFSSKEAEKLADATGDDGFPLDYRKVKKALDGGCKHRMAVRIFAD